MPSRLRTIDVRGYVRNYRRKDLISTLTGYQVSEISDFRPGPGPCRHIRRGVINWKGARWTWAIPDLSVPTHHEFFDFPWTPPNLLQLREFAKNKASELDWEKLPSSSQFGLIQLIAEIDDTLAVFATRFWRELSYGSFTWGVVPFISDLKALCDAVSNLSKDIRSFSYEDTWEGFHKPALLNQQIGGFNYPIQTETLFRTHVQGLADISFQNPAALALDWLALHPDLASAWDLIPFSFVVDYLLPVGDYLESFRQGGWIKCARLTGWQSLKMTVHAQCTWQSGPLAGVSFRLTDKPYVEYNRWNGPTILTVPETRPELSFEIPSFHQMFNMAYLLGSRKR